MKKLIIVVVSMLAVSLVNAYPYFYVYPVTKGSQAYISQGALFTPSFDLSQTAAFTNLAIVYHPITSGSIIPSELQPYIPPESWSINLGGSWGTSQTMFGPGISINLLDSVRSYAVNLLRLSNSKFAQGLASQLSLGNGPVSLNVGPQWTFKAIDSGTWLPFNEW